VSEIDIPHSHEEESEEYYVRWFLENGDCIDKFVQDNIQNQHTYYSQVKIKWTPI
jgi:hypothetical protein